MRSEELTTILQLITLFKRMQQGEKANSELPSGVPPKVSKPAVQVPGEVS